MKFKKLIIVLLAVLMVLVLASCSNEPKNQKEDDQEDKPIYSESLIYKLTATKGRNVGWWSADKFVLSFSAGQEKVKNGDVLTLKYRSTREITQFNIRNSENKWIYEQPKTSSGKEYPLPEGFKSEPDADGWITITFTFGDKWWDGTAIDVTTTYPSAWRFDFIGEIVQTDVLEVKDIKLNDTPLELSKTKVSDSSAYGNIMPTFEETHDGAWQKSADWVVFFFEGEPGEVDKEPEYERVFDGMTFTRDWAAGYETKEHYTLKLLTDYKQGAAEFDPTTPITKNTRLFVMYVGDPQQVTFDTGDGGPEIAAQAIEYGTYAKEPEAPTKEGFVFAGWFADAERTRKFDFKNTAIMANTVIYAGFGASTAVTFNAENGEEEHTVVNVANGFPVAAIADPKYGSRIFDGWYLEGSETAYDFSTPVTTAIELHAHWINATDVTLDLNYTGAPEATSFKAALDAILSEADKNLIVANRPGFFFEGWYDDAECKDADKHDFASNVTGPFTLYAKWRPGTIAQLTSTYAYTDSNTDKFRIKFQDGDYKTALNTLGEGEFHLLSFMYRSTTPIEKFSVRGSYEYTYEKDFKTKNSVDASNHLLYDLKVTSGTDGWTSVEYTFPEDGVTDRKSKTITYGSDSTFFFDFISYTIVKGDVIEIQGMALDGNELTIDGGNTQSGSSSTKPDYKLVEDNYPWTAHTVTFNMGVADAIDPIEVAYGGKITAPDTPEVEGYRFLGWFADALYETEFDFAGPIFDNATIYAKFEEKTVSSYTVSFDLNYTGAEVLTVTVDEGESVGVCVGRPGYYLDGWYTKAEDGEEVDLETYTVSSDVTLYANWIEETSYVRVIFDDAEASYKRFDLQFSADVFEPQAGDVIAFKYRSKDNKVVSGCLRNSAGSGKVIYWSNLSGYTKNTDDDGDWNTFYYVYGSKDYQTITYPMTGIRFELAQSDNEANFAKGDYIEILGFTINGKAPKGGISDANFPTATSTGKATVSTVTPE